MKTKTNCIMETTKMSKKNISILLLKTTKLINFQVLLLCILQKLKSKWHRRKRTKIIDSTFNEITRIGDGWIDLRAFLLYNSTQRQAPFMVVIHIHLNQKQSKNRSKGWGFESITGQNIATNNPNRSPKPKTTHNHKFQLKFEYEIPNKQANHIQPKWKLPIQKQTDK